MDLGHGKVSRSYAGIAMNNTIGAWKPCTLPDGRAAMGVAETLAASPVAE